jgi:ribosome-binding protein aMBF1 (putative translation factor)
MSNLDHKVVAAFRPRTRYTRLVAEQRSGSRRKIDFARADDPKEFSVSVGEAVRRARLGREWTQVQLAEAASLSPNYVARLERGEVSPSLFVARQICGALGVDLDKILPAAAPRTGRRWIAG